MTKDSEILGFSHLGTPNLQLVRFLCTIGCSFPALGSFDGIECSCRVPIAARSQNPTGKRPQQCQITFCGCMLGTVIMMESYVVSFDIFPH